jgi:hypothetical protein
MFSEFSKKSIQQVSGGDKDIAASVGGFLGWVTAEYREHYIGAGFGPVGVVIAHYATKEK